MSKRVPIVYHTNQTRRFPFISTTIGSHCDGPPMQAPAPAQAIPSAMIVSTVSGMPGWRLRLQGPFKAASIQTLCIAAYTGSTGYREPAYVSSSDGQRGSPPLRDPALNDAHAVRSRI